MCQEVRFGPNDGIRGWWLSADPRLSTQFGGRTLIYYHGNGGSIGAKNKRAERDRSSAEPGDGGVFGGGEVTFRSNPDKGAARMMLLGGGKFSEDCAATPEQGPASCLL